MSAVSVGHSGFRRNDGRTMKLQILRLPGGADLPLPAYATSGSAGLDLRSAESLTLKPGARALVPTGIAIALA